MNALVGLAIHTNPWVLSVHLIYECVPLRLRLVNNRATEQLISLLDLCNSHVSLGLEGFLEIIEFLFSCFFLSLSLVFWKLK